MKSYILIGYFCFINPTSIEGYSCMNFYENPVKLYNTREECIIKSKELAKKINKGMEKSNLEILELVMYCLNDPNVDL